jgi:hypothetical protein
MPGELFLGPSWLRFLPATTLFAHNTPLLEPADVESLNVCARVRVEEGRVVFLCVHARVWSDEEDVRGAYQCMHARG